jgi:hypothetical protein
MKSSGEVGDNNMVFEADGSFEIIASPTPKPGNWLRMEPETNYLLLRQTLLDRTVERPGHFHIERIGAPASPKPWNVATIAAGLEKVTSYVEGTAKTFANLAKLLMNQPNRFTDFGPDFFKNSGGDPRLTYMVGYFSIAEDEAWVIDFMPPRAPYWNFSIYSHWNQTFDARYRKVGVNNHDARLNGDGSMTIVVASRDAGLGNWLDTDGHIEGQGVFRGLDSLDVPTMTFRVVKLAELQATSRDRPPA